MTPPSFSTITPLMGPGNDAAADVNLRSLLGTLPVPMVVHDLTEKAAIRFVNHSFFEAFGFVYDETPTVSAWAERAYPDPAYRLKVMARWWAEIEARRSSGTIVPPGEYSIVDMSGRPRDVVIGFALLGDLVIVTFQDLTETRAAEVALAAERQQNEQTAFALTENMPAGAYTMVLRPGAAMAEFAFLSRQFLRILDLTREEATGDPMTGFLRVHPDDRPRWIAKNAEAFGNRQPFKEEARIIAHGKTRWIRSESIPRDLPDGSVIWEGILVDISDLKEVERRLHEVLTAAHAFTWHLDLRKNKVRFNGAWAMSNGYEPSEIELDLPCWLDTLHPDDVSSVITTLDTLRIGEVERQSVRCRRKVQDSQWVWLQVYAGISERDPEGRPITLSGVSFDVTSEVTKRAQAEEKQAQLREDLQRAQQRDTAAQIAGGVAHDLNNLIAVVAGTVEMLESQSDGNELLDEGLGRIQRSMIMARDLIAGLGAIVRPDLERLKHDLGKLLREAVDLLGPKRIAHHDVRFEVTNEVQAVWANPTEVAQVIVNLSINACDSGTSAAPAKVTLKTLPEGSPSPNRPPDAGVSPEPGRSMALFTISDTGVGIAPEVRARMFRPNFSTKGKAGTGLGLLIVSTILQSNRAALWIDSTPGEGTQITVAWPTASPTQTDVNLMPSDHPTFQMDRTAPKNILNGLRVMVVDDLVDVAEVLADMLEASGAVAVALSDPEEAAEALAEDPGLWSAVVTDLHMAGMDGRALAKHAGSLPVPVPVVLVTARPDMLDDGPAVEFSDILSKPVTAVQLVRAVRKAADRNSPINPS